MLDGHEVIAALLADDATAPGAVIIEHVRRDGYLGGLTSGRSLLHREGKSDLAWRYGAANEGPARARRGGAQGQPREAGWAATGRTATPPEHPTHWGKSGCR